jgi:hypothetical protein
MAEEHISKMTFMCPSFIGLFKWVVMTFFLKNAGATYQRAMSLIFHDLLIVNMEVYIDDIVTKSFTHTSHLVDLCLAFERVCHYVLKMNPLKCALSVLAGKFLVITIH